MKPKFKTREIVLTTLPLLLIGGTALLLSRGVKMPLHAPDVGQMVCNARRPTLFLQEVKATWVSPTERALGMSEKGCTVSVKVDAVALPGQVRPSKVPSLAAIDIVDENGRSIKATLIKKRSFSNTTAYTGFNVGTTWPSASGQGIPNATYSIYATIPFIHLPPATKSATLVGSVGWGTAPSIPVKFEVVPSWMRRRATRLHVEGVTWRSSNNNNVSEIEVICRVTNPRKPYVFGTNDGETDGAAGLGRGYEPSAWKELRHSDGDDLVLAEWSQRVESGDGRLNSLDLLRDHIEKEADKIPMKNGGRVVEPGLLAASFNPLCRLAYTNAQNGIVRLRYSMSRVPSTFVNPVFRCEIYLVGDGVVRVRYPLKTKP